MVPRLHEIGVDGRLLGLAMALAVITALLVGAMPAFRMSRVDQAQVMNDRGAGGQGGARRADTRVRNVLVVAQMMVATMLLVGAGLLINSFTRLARVDPGWNASGLLMFYLVMPQDYSTARKAALIDTLLTELRALPEVTRAGYTYAGPLLGIVDTRGLVRPAGALAGGDARQPGQPASPRRQPRLPADDGRPAGGRPLVRAERRCGGAAGDHREPHRDAAAVQQRESGRAARAPRRTHGVSRRSRSSAWWKTCGSRGWTPSRRRRCSSTIGRCWR